ncbi:GrpB protein [uncultured archaeon]|nr:GrpB protein [uncultured archaeon]
MLSRELLLKKAVFERYTFKPHTRIHFDTFAREEKLLKKNLGKIKDKEIEHVGSTAIHGLGGKGIVDILIFVQKKNLSKAKRGIIKSGFNYNGNWQKRRYFFSKYYLHKKRAHLVHVHLTAETKEFHKLLALVDYLKRNKTARAKYEKLKRKASEMYWTNGENYRKFKKKLLSKLAKKALLDYRQS